MENLFDVINNKMFSVFERKDRRTNYDLLATIYDIFVSDERQQAILKEDLVEKITAYIKGRPFEEKSALNLAEIQHQNGHGNHMGRSLPQLCSDQPHATFTLRQTESALHFHALALIPIVLSFVSGFTLLRPP